MKNIYKYNKNYNNLKTWKIDICMEEKERRGGGGWKLITLRN